MWGYVVFAFAISLTFFGTVSYAYVTDSVAYYEFENNDVSDSSDFNNDGFMINNPTFISGQIGQAINFNGIDQRVEFADNSFNSQSKGTVAAWVNPSTAQNSVIFGAADSNTSTGLWRLGTAVSGSEVQILVQSRTPNNVVKTIDTFPINTWTHVALTGSGNVADPWKIYVNGIEVDVEATTGSNQARWWDSQLINTGVLRYDIGAWERSTGTISYFNGQIDDVQIYDDILTLDEIKDIAIPKSKITFDQSIFAMEHSGFLTIIDPSVSDNSIEATISSDVDDIDITLTRLNPNNPFTSYFIKFTSTPNNSESSPELDVIHGSVIDVKYNGVSYIVASIVNDSNELDKEKYNYKKENPFLIANPCPETYVDNGVSLELGGDNDKDGICDAWEQDNFIVNYPSTSSYKLCDVNADYDSDPLGGSVCPSLTKKDIYVEIDYIEGHAPNMDALQQVVTAFENAPSTFEAPDGFQLHVIVDEQILPHIDEIKFESTDTDPGFNQIKAQTFGSKFERDDNNWIESNELAKAQVFYYYLWIHDRYEDIGSSGYSELGGNDGIISLGSFDGHVGTIDQQAGTFMHELGHNFGLDHGGSITDTTNCKPNLLSVMSYSRQYSDLVNRSLDFSRQSVGTFDDPTSTSLGKEDELFGVGVGPYSYDPNSQIIFGMGGGETQLENVNQPTITWPQDWENVRTISDSDGREVCPPVDPTEEPQELDGVDQWSIIDLSRKGVDWRDGRSLNPQSPLNIHTDKSEYLPGEDIEISGKTAEIPSFKVTVEILPSSLSYVEFDAESNVKHDKSFKHKFHDVSPATGPGNYIVKATHGNDEYSTMIYIGNDANPFAINHEDWCMSKNEAKELALKYDLNEADFLDHAPLCSTSYSNQDYEIDMNNVRAARSVNVDNLLGFVERLDNSDFKQQNHKDNLKNSIDNINNLFSDGKIGNTNKIESLHGYIALKSSIDNTITDENIKRNLLNTLPSVNTLNTLGVFASVTDEDFKQPNDKDNLKKEIDDIGDLFLEGKKIEALHGYIALKSSIDNTIIDENIKEDFIDAMPSTNTLITFDVLNSTTDEDFINSKDALINEIKSIRPLVLNDQMIEALEAYEDLKISVENKIDNETAKQELITIIDRNIVATSHAIPEFETIAILILIISITSIIILSRKTSILGINYK